MACKKCGVELSDDARRRMCDPCRAERSKRRKKLVIGAGVAVVGVFSAIAVAVASSKGSSAAGVLDAAADDAGDDELYDDRFDGDDDDEDDDEYEHFYDDDDDDDDDSSTNLGRAIDMMNGEVPYDADFVERWL